MPTLQPFPFRQLNGCRKPHQISHASYQSDHSPSSQRPQKELITSKQGADNSSFPITPQPQPEAQAPRFLCICKCPRHDFPTPTHPHSMSL